MIQQDNPIIRPFFRLGEQIVPEFLDPQQNGIGGRCLERYVYISTNNLTAFGDGSKTGRGLEFEGD